MASLKEIGVQCTVALCAMFSNVSANAADVAPATRLEQAKTGTPAMQIGRAMYEKPSNDFTLHAAKKALLALPAAEITGARSAYHDLALGERDLAREIGQSLARADGKKSIDEVKSPEMKAALIGLQQQIASDKAKGDKTSPFDRTTQFLKQIDADSHTREDAFKTMVQEAATEKRAMDTEERRKQGFTR